MEKQGKQPLYKVVTSHPKFRGFKEGDELHMVKGHPSGKVLSHADWEEGKPVVTLEDADKYQQIFKKVEVGKAEEDDIKGTQKKPNDR